MVVNVHGEEMCEEWDMPKSGCAHCRGVKAPETERARGVPERYMGPRSGRTVSEPTGSIPAVYNGTCRDCGDDICKGEPIRFGKRGWVHEECA